MDLNTYWSIKNIRQIIEFNKIYYEVDLIADSNKANVFNRVACRINKKPNNNRKCIHIKSLEIPQQEITIRLDKLNQSKLYKYNIDTKQVGKLFSNFIKHLKHYNKIK